MREVISTFDVKGEIVPNMVAEARRVWAVYTLAPMLTADDWGPWITTNSDIEEIET